VWANPRTQSARYRPEVGGMAAAWPYCDAVVSAYNFDALDDLLTALSAPSGRGRPVMPLPWPATSPEEAADEALTAAARAALAAAPSRGVASPPAMSLPITQRWTPWRG
jgi:hypothetical protein